MSNNPLPYRQIENEYVVARQLDSMYYCGASAERAAAPDKWDKLREELESREGERPAGRPENNKRVCFLVRSFVRFVRSFIP